MRLIQADVNARLELVYQEVHDDPFWDYMRTEGINLVPGYGQRDPKLCKVLIVGEAPGATENARLRPFCGPSGRILNILMREAGLRLDTLPCGHSLDRAENDEVAADEHDRLCVANAFVTNVVKYRPPGNRTPSWREIEHGRSTVRKEWLALAGPRAIVCVGGVAHSALSPNSIVSISTVAGQGWYQMTDNRTICFSQYHPAYGLRRGTLTQQMMTRHWRTMGEMLREEGVL